VAVKRRWYAEPPAMATVVVPALVVVAFRTLVALIRAS
jgi:hypothetical protein